jgi:hypothetical protein
LHRIGNVAADCERIAAFGLDGGNRRLAASLSLL